MQKRTRIACSVLAMAVIASACSEVPPTEPRVGAPDDFVMFVGPQDPQAHVTRNDHFASIAKEVPGFGGIYVEDGRTVVAMVPGDEPLSVDDLQRALGDRLAPMGVNVAVEPMAVREAQYDFAQLNAIHHALRPALGLGGVVSAGISAAANRVTIGVEHAGAAAAVEQAISMAGVPREAVIISDADPIIPLTLQGFHRPVGGGLQINFPGFLCTLGFNVRSPEAPAVQGFVINSHCTNVRSDGGAGMTPYGQPLLAQFIGNEVHDLPFFTGGACPAGRVCRWSDSAGGVYASGVDNMLGAIYRTTGVGSLTVDPVNPLASIVAERAFPFLGDTQHKTGRTTGWRTGVVTGSCVDTNVGVTNITLLCQDHVSGPPPIVGPGDSGSPVWETFPDTESVRLVGILWGGTADGSLWAQSSMNEVRFENQPPPGFSYITFPGQ